MKNKLFSLIIFLFATKLTAATIGSIKPDRIFSNDRIEITINLPDPCHIITDDSPIIDSTNKIIRFNILQLQTFVACAQIVTPIKTTLSPLSPGTYSVRTYQNNILQDSRDISVINTNANPIPTLSVYGIILLTMMMTAISRHRKYFPSNIKQPNS
jgi:hypothetical protein